MISTRAGYTGGQNDHVTYRNHPGHAEAVEIVFDPSKTTYRDILTSFFQIHDPSTLNHQGNDIGTSHRSAIFPLTPEQEQVAKEAIADVDASGLSNRTTSSGVRTATTATTLVPAGSCPAASRRRRLPSGHVPVGACRRRVGGASPRHQ